MTQATLGVFVLLLLGTLAIFLVVAGHWLYDRLGPLERERRKADQYRLFAVRRDLVALVAEGKISESDSVFQFLYRGVNSAIPRAKAITLPTFVAALRSTSLLDEKLRRVFLESVNHSDRAVREVARTFFITVADILVERSWFLKASLCVARTGIALGWLRQGLRRHFSGRPPFLGAQYDAYRLHKAVQSTTRELMAV